MQLIGMLDSPYVRRVAISLQLLGLRFTHHPVSVFRQFDEFVTINPVVKAPTLVCDDGTVLMDSTLILDYVEFIAPAGRSLLPTEPAARPRALRTIGLALAACEKSVQHIYERMLRPEDKQHQPWLDRVTAQMQQALRALEAECAPALDPAAQAGLTTAVAWHFVQQTLPQLAPAAEYPRLAQLSETAEQLPQFRAAPYGDGTYPVTH
jgi:glutathione S-transferase